MRRRHQLPVGQGENQPRTCIVTFASVWMYTSSLPALLSGESSSIMRHWWQMSGRYSAAFLLFFFRMCAWSSLFSSWKLWPAFTVSKLARSSTTMSRCAVSFSRPLAGRGATVAIGCLLAWSFLSFLLCTMESKEAAFITHTRTRPAGEGEKGQERRHVCSTTNKRWFVRVNDTRVTHTSHELVARRLDWNDRSTGKSLRLL